MIYPIQVYNNKKIISKSNTKIIWINPSQVSLITSLTKDLFEIKICDVTFYIDGETFEWLRKQ